jgi:tetratricopeptide (TPR) repeat protein
MLGVGVLAPLLTLGAGLPAPLVIDYPETGSVFPPEITAPQFIWRDSSPARLWRIEITFAGSASPIRAVTKGERLRNGEIDPRCISPSNRLPELTPQQAASQTWTPGAATWSAIKTGSLGRAATVTILGYADERSTTPLSRGVVSIETSPDPVGAPIFYRDVPLMPSETEKGIIKPLNQADLPLIAWRLRNIAESRSRLLLTGMYTCANCHSFSLDGKTLGMDLDGPKNDKGLYAMVPVRRQTSITTKDVIEWSTLEGKLTGDIRVGFMSQVSPDGQYVVTMIQGPSERKRGALNNFYTANFKDYRFLQVFYPTRGILAWYSRVTRKLQPLPGADDPRYVHTNAVWTPDGKNLVFARAEARDPFPPDAKAAERANDPNETQIRYDLYRIPFNGGKGGQARRISGASENGMSNAFPKVSPDGRWIIFVQCRNGELMRPDSQLFIVPVNGGVARRLRANTPLMNSWHSFSPNGRWLVFSSKSRGPYTKMFLTHLDEQGNSSPAILIDNSTAANRAVNIPEFVNIPPDGLLKIDVPAVEFYRVYNVAWEMARQGRYDEAVIEWNKALQIRPDEANVHMNLGVALARLGKPLDAIAEYRKALQLTPGVAEIQLRLGKALADVGRPDEAIATYRQILDSKSASRDASDEAMASNLIGEALIAKGRVEEALKQFARATELKRGFAPFLYDQAIALARLNRFDQAQQAVEAALNADRNMALAHALLGGLLARKRQLREAAREYRTTLELTPEFSRAHLDLASVLANQGDMGGAITHLREAARGADPAVAQAARQALARLGQSAP